MADATPQVRLRLHHGGTFRKDPETGEWRYAGGSTYNDGVPRTIRYHELCLRVNSKVGEPVAIKYQAPGEDLDVEALVSVTDDDDLKELVNEYFDALERPGVQTRTFRIHVYLLPALQFEIEPEEAMALQEEAAHEAMPEDYSDLYSCDPSSDTECQAAAFSQAQLYTAATSGMAGLHFATQAASQAAATPAALTTVAAAPAATESAWDPAVEVDHALSNLNRSLQAYPGVMPGRPADSPPEYTADDFDVEDPYMEDPEPAQQGSSAMRPYKATAGLSPFSRPVAADPVPSGVPSNTQGTSLYNRPLERVRDAASGLPSHISAFGDMGTTGADQNNSLKLPSHISAFGEGNEDLPLPSGVHGLPGVSDPGVQWNASHCITQDFGHKSQSMQNSQGGAGDKGGKSGGAQGNLTEAPSCPTPKAFLATVHNTPKSQVASVVKIGEGAFGEVSSAEVFPFGTVAIKWLKKDRFAKYSESFQREAEVLARLNHPNIIRMFGLVTEPAGSPPASVAGGSAAAAGDAGPGSARSGTGSGESLIAGIMMEYLSGGSLAQRFRAMAVQGRRLSLKERCRIALQAALGMAYLHEQTPAVIHFDLKPDNLLLQNEGDNVLVKVADFGLSKHKIQSYVTCHDLRGTLPYMAPELVRCPNQVCEKCDVWSMGVVMWEMCTLEIPFQELTAQDILRGLMQGSLHLRMPSNCEPEWRQLITACMEPEPAQRPTFRQLAARLEEISKKLASQQSLSQMQQQELQAMQQQAQQQAAQAMALAQAQQQQEQHQQQLLAHQAFTQQHPQQLALGNVQALLYAQAAQQQLMVQQTQQQVQQIQQVQHGLYGNPAAAALGLGHVGQDLMSQLYAPQRMQQPLLPPAFPLQL